MQVPNEHGSTSSLHAHGGHHNLVYAACGAGTLEEVLISAKSLLMALQSLPPTVEKEAYTIHILTGNARPSYGPRLGEAY